MEEQERRKGRGKGMAMTKFEALFNDFPESRFTGMVALRMSIEEFKKEVRKDFMKAMRYLYKIQGFVWGIYTAGMIDADRRDLLMEEADREAREWIEKELGT